MALPDYLRPATGTSRTTGISSEAIANNANFTGSEFDNATAKDGLADIEVVLTATTAPTAGQFSISLLYALDGTNYEAANANAKVVAWAERGTANRLFWPDVPIAPYKFKPYVANEALGQTITVTVTIYTRAQVSITDA